MLTIQMKVSPTPTKVMGCLCHEDGGRFKYSKCELEMWLGEVRRHDLLALICKMTGISVEYIPTEEPGRTPVGCK